MDQVKIQNQYALDVIAQQLQKTPRDAGAVDFPSVLKSAPKFQSIVTMNVPSYLETTTRYDFYEL